jgi:membrane protease YdiL (CAAX protease family)
VSSRLPAPLVRALTVVRNPTERRLRLPLRLLLAAVVFVVLSAVGSEALRLLTAVDTAGVLAQGPAGGLTGLRLGTTLGSTVVTVVAVVLVGVALDRRRLADFGFHVDRGWWLDCAFGAALGLGLQAAVFAVGLAAGWVRVAGVTDAAGGSFVTLAVVSLVVFACVSISEELLLRGYLLTNLAEGLAGLGVPGLARLGSLSGRAAVLLATLATSALFGLLHAANPNATLLSTASVALAGVFLAAGYLLTGELSIPLGLHFGWNYAQGVVFGFPVSGVSLSVAVVRTRETGPDLVTGGAFGPEAGLLGIGAVLLGTAAIAWWARERTGLLALDPAVWTPDLRWRSEDAEADGAAEQ